MLLCLMGLAGESIPELDIFPPDLTPPIEWQSVFGTPVRLSSHHTFRCSGVVLGKDLVLTAAHCAVFSGLMVNNIPVTSSRYPWGDRDAVLLTVPGIGGLPAHWGHGTPQDGVKGFVTGWGCDDGHVLWIRDAEVVSDGVYRVKVCGGDSGGGVYDATGGLLGVVESIYVCPWELGGMTWLHPV
jgi:hypothetical protein